MVRKFLIGLAIAAACWRPAAATSCLQQVEQVAQATGLAKHLPNIPGLSGGGAAGDSGSATPQSSAAQATDNNTPSDGSAASRPSSMGSLLSQLNGTRQSSGTSDKQKQAAGLLQSASEHGAQGDEQGCYAQLAQAKQLLFGSK